MFYSRHSGRLSAFALLSLQTTGLVGPSLSASLCMANYRKYRGAGYHSSVVVVVVVKSECLICLQRCSGLPSTHLILWHTAAQKTKNHVVTDWWLTHLKHNFYSLKLKNYLFITDITTLLNVFKYPHVHVKEQDSVVDCLFAFPLILWVCDFLVLVLRFGLDLFSLCKWI